MMDNKVHDLEVNPNDLPPFYTQVVCKGKRGGYKVAYCCNSQLSKEVIWKEISGKTTSVTQWKYIDF